MSPNVSRLNIFKKKILSIALLSFLTLSSVWSKDNKAVQQGVYDTESDRPACQPEFFIKHIALSCLEAQSLRDLPMPNVYSPCGPIASLDFTDEVFELGCHVNGFEGWFKKDNWIQSKIKGDGGVDVTGAPNALLVEGANKALVEVIPGSTTALTVVVPADGFITFDWSIVGGSNLSLTVRAGESVMIPDRYFVSQSLKAGDTFSLLFQSTFEDLAGRIELTNFQFLSDATTVIKRVWTAVDQRGHTAEGIQFLNIKGIDAEQILMPMDVEISDKAYREEIPSPELTGFPVFDNDADWNTPDDQVNLQDKSCSLKISWTDQVDRLNEFTVIYRKWTIEQGCGRNIITYTQEIKLLREGVEKIQPARKGIGMSEKKFRSGNELKLIEKDYYSYIFPDDN